MVQVYVMEKVLRDSKEKVEGKRKVSQVAFQSAELGQR